MATFYDNQKKAWSIEFDAPLIGRLRERWEVIDFGRRPHDALQAMADDPVLLELVLWEICEREAQAASISRDQFAKRITGAVLDAATDALLGALEAFFPPRQARQVQALREMMAASTRAQQVGADRLLARSSDLDKRLTRLVEEDIDQALDRLLTTRTPTAPPSMPSPPATPSADNSGSTPSD